MSSLIDISLELHAGLPTWPGGAGFRLESTSRISDGATANNSRLDCDVHVGTHVDAPHHFVSGGATVEQLSLDVLMGPARVVALPEVTQIEARDLEQLGLPADTQRLLLRTRNSDLWQADGSDFVEDFVALTADAARWVVGRGIQLIGVDYLSVQRFHDGPETHRALLGAGVVVVEGLALGHVEPGQYELLCLPLKLRGSDGAPARAVLRPLGATP